MIFFYRQNKLSSLKSIEIPLVQKKRSVATEEVELELELGEPADRERRCVQRREAVHELR